MVEKEEEQEEVYVVDKLKVIVSGMNKEFTIEDLEEERCELSIEWKVDPEDIHFELMMASSPTPPSPLPKDMFPIIIACTLVKEGDKT